MDLVENLPLSSTVKAFLKSGNSSQSYESISSGTFLWLTVYMRQELPNFCKTSYVSPNSDTICGPPGCFTATQHCVDVPFETSSTSAQSNTVVRLSQKVHFRCCSVLSKRAAWNPGLGFTWYIFVKIMRKKWLSHFRSSDLDLFISKLLRQLGLLTSVTSPLILNVVRFSVFVLTVDKGGTDEQTDRREITRGGPHSSSSSSCCCCWFGRKLLAYSV